MVTHTSSGWGLRTGFESPVDGPGWLERAGVFARLVGQAEAWSRAGHNPCEAPRRAHRAGHGSPEVELGRERPNRLQSDPTASDSTRLSKPVLSLDPPCGGCVGSRRWRSGRSPVGFRAAALRWRLSTQAVRFESRRFAQASCLCRTGAPRPERPDKPATNPPHGGSRLKPVGLRGLATRSPLLG